MRTTISVSVRVWMRSETIERIMMAGRRCPRGWICWLTRGGEGEFDGRDCGCGCCRRCRCSCRRCLVIVVVADSMKLKMYDHVSWLGATGHITESRRSGHICASRPRLRYTSPLFSSSVIDRVSTHIHTWDSVDRQQATNWKQPLQPLEESKTDTETCAWVASERHPRHNPTQRNQCRDGQNMQMR